ncbi:MAG: phage tail protein [Reyranellaceae bacterium]
MPTTTNFPSIAATFGSSLARAPRTLKNAFGNGYEQRAGDGLNLVPQVWDVAFENIAFGECTTIDTFLAGQKGYLAFLWTPPGAGSALQFKCESWSVAKTSGTTGTLKARFEQVFDL